jgi:hypoxanthine-DNA glycosylase
MLQEQVIQSFNAIVNEDCEKLILGTMPGRMSLDRQEYYGHPDNTFWDIIVRILDSTHQEDTVEKFAYDEKINLLLKKRIALWDVLQFCNRKGNLDNSIKNEIKNDFNLFLSQYPKIKTIIFNGQKAEKYFKSCFKELLKTKTFEMKALPSTSSSNTSNAFKKLKQWRQALT